jgi:hypothetical protein
MLYINGRMSLPFFSCICPTYGRVSHLEEAIQCFLNQKYEGERELLVVNSFPDQTLIGGFQNVRIINLKERPPNLGNLRNVAIGLAKGTHLAVWDDDDIYLENHLSNFAKGLTDGSSWVWLSHQFYLEAYQFRAVVKGTMNVVCFSKAAWQAVGGYPERDCGEDRDIVSKITKQFTGSKVELRPNEISLCYSWQNSVYHTSGQGDDIAGRASGHDRIGEFTRNQVIAGRVPTGDIALKPHLQFDYPAMARDFVRRNTQTELKPASFQGIPANTHQPYAPDITRLNPLPKITVVYVIGSDTPEYNALAARFASSYVACPPGLPHDTIIACNSIALNNVARKLWRCYPSCSLERHDNSGWDIGAFIAVSKKLTSDLVVYFGSKSHFKRAGWLIRMVEAWKKYGPGFYGATSSYEVSPHINTSGFWCSPDLMRQYPVKVNSREDRYRYEHGPLACWRLAVRLGLPAKLVTWEGEYDWPQWREPDNIFRRGDQSNCLAYFEHTRRFDEEGPEMRATMSRLSDTITDPYFIRALRDKDYKLTSVDERSAEHFKASHLALDWDKNLKHATA